MKSPRSVQTKTLFETIDEETVENDVDVVTVKRTKVTQVVETITATNTKAIKSETPNKPLTWRLWNRTRA